MIKVTKQTEQIGESLKMNSYSLILSVLLAVTLLHTVESWFAKCEHGEFIRDPDDCRAYSRCVHGFKVKMDPCPVGTVFSTKLNVCVWEHDKENNDCVKDEPDNSEDSSEISDSKDDDSSKKSDSKGDSSEKSDSKDDSSDKSDSKGDSSDKSDSKDKNKYAKSCKDIFKKQKRPVSGTFRIYPKRKSEPVTVFCDFYDRYGYTFISRKDLGKLESLDKLYTEADHALVRILFRNSKQRDVRIEQISAFKDRYPLSFQLSQNVSYTAPMNEELRPFIYMGLLPVEYASIKKSVQGYRAAGYDAMFENSDSNPNSYFAFFANPDNKPEDPYYETCCIKREDFAFAWVQRAQPIPEGRTMSADFYFMFEVHMGGGGCYFASGHVADNISGAAIGLPFAM